MAENPIQMLSKPGNKEALLLWQRVLMENVRDDLPDLSQRQLVILLTITTQKGPHTVRGLAASMNIGKPAVVRAIDSLSRYKLAERMRDPKDRRNLHITPTINGVKMIADFSERVLQSLGEVA